MLFDINEIRIRSEESLKTEGNAERSRVIFQETLMDWIDYYNENLKNEIGSSEEISVKKSISLLWIEYSNLEKYLKQYKKVVQVYEDSIKDPVTFDCINLYISYANFCDERSKKANAQKVYIKALCIAKLNSYDSDKLWYNFLEFMNKYENDITKRLSIEQLHEAVKLQLIDTKDILIAPTIDFHHRNYNIEEDIFIPEVTTTFQMDTSSTNEAIIEAESKEDSTMKSPVHHYQQPPPSPPKLLSTNINMDMIPVLPMEILDLESIEFQPEILMKIFHKRAPALFSATDKQPMCYGVTYLTSDEKNELETYLETSLELLAQPQSQQTQKANFILDILEALWTTQALKERHFDGWFAELKQIHLQEV